MEWYTVVFYVWIVPALVAFGLIMPLQWFENKAKHKQGFITLKEFCEGTGVSIFPLINIFVLFIAIGGLSKIFFDAYGNAKLFAGKKHYTQEDVNTLLSEIESLKELANGDEVSIPEPVHIPIKDMPTRMKRVMN